VSNEEAEATLSDWLAHPMEFGVKPKSVRFIETIPATIAGEAAPIPVHVVEYEMPDGSRGKGFVNPITWSFAGDLPYDKLTNQDLVLAYSGFAFLFSALHNGTVEKDFEPVSVGEFRASLAERGLGSIEISEQYRVGDSEFFSLSGQDASGGVVGAGSVESSLVLKKSDPKASLPAIYTFLGMVMRDEL